ncbi:hypothetical protein DTO212C5_4111 [Paecilomyces variotii]|nr:hypothetical protein DTO212C5_4111 [Paecilomyces variotii]
MPPTLQAARTRSQQTVETRWNRICNHKDELLTHSQCARMGIQVTRLELETGPSSGSSSNPREENVPVTGSYFEPLTDEFMSDHPIDSDRFQKLLKEIPDFLVLRDYDPEAAAAEERREGFG